MTAAVGYSLKIFRTQGTLVIMKNNPLVTLSKEFALDIMLLNDNLRNNGKSNAIFNQLLRSGTSIGANIHEANYASSKADFISKLQIALKECYETDYWLSLFFEAKMFSDDVYSNLYSKCCKLRRMLIASLNTAKQN